MTTRTYAITVQGRLSERFATAFERARIEPAADGQTRLLTEPFDQPQLHGILDRLSDFGIEIVEIEVVAS